MGTKAKLSQAMKKLKKTSKFRPRHWSFLEQGDRAVPEC